MLHVFSLPLLQIIILWVLVDVCPPYLINSCHLVLITHLISCVQSIKNERLYFIALNKVNTVYTFFTENHKDKQYLRTGLMLSSQSTHLSQKIIKTSNIYKCKFVLDLRFRFTLVWSIPWMDYIHNSL